VKGEYASLCHACEEMIKNEEYYNKAIGYLKEHKYEILISDVLLSDNIVRIEKVLRELGLFESLKRRYLKVKELSW
jgi:tRNA U54 and U55 pseudouridine synthase Pus10